MTGESQGSLGAGGKSLHKVLLSGVWGGGGGGGHRIQMQVP